MSIQVGQSLLHYRLAEKIGEGGMGAVWKALDTTLNREVAIKVLPPAFTGDPERLARFEREAQVLASLNHPNIAAIYGLHQAGEVRFLAMELVPGEDLQAVLDRGPMPVEQALDVAVQMAAGIEAAHDKGIVHRDLKPANVVFTPDGGVKVLDFGLAKAFGAVGVGGASAEELAHSPTITSVGSVAGVILGTANYMSPEQARGQPVDQRADVWAFGCVLYELFSGAKPFQGDTITDVLAAIVRAEPDWEALEGRVSPAVVGLLQRCLRKNQRDRLRSVGDVGRSLGEFAAEGVAHAPLATGAADPTGAEPVAATPRRRGLSTGIVTVLLIVVAAASLELGRRLSRSSPAAEQHRFSIQLPEGLFLPAGVGNTLAVSPDGKRVAYLADDLEERRLYLREINDFESRLIPGTDGAGEMSFSPDGEWVAFRFDEGTRKISLSNFEIYPLCDPCGHGDWGDDGNYVFSRGGELWRVPGAGGTPELLAKPDPAAGITSLIRPAVLPGSKQVVFEIGEYHSGGVGVLDVESGATLKVTDNGVDPFYSTTGHIIFARDSTLFAVPFDPDRFEPSGREAHVLQGVRVENAGALQARLSSNGMLVYAPSAATQGTRLSWVDRQGNLDPINDEWRRFKGPRISPDGRRIAAVIHDGGKTDIWIIDVESGGLVPLTSTGNATAPIWTPDGKSITHAAGFSGSFSIRSISADGGSDEETLITSEYRLVPDAWHPDRNLLAFVERRDNDDLYLFDPETATRSPLVVTEANEADVAFSPDGNSFSYTSERSGRSEAYLRPFPGPGSDVPVSIGGGYSAIWSPDGSELFYRGLRRFYSASIDGLRVGERGPLFDAVFFWSDDDRAHADMHPDGKRLVVLKKNEAEALPVIHVVLNWAEQLSRDAPPDR